VEAAVETAAEHLRGLDVVVANAGVAAQLPLIGGDPEVFERTIDVNLVGVYYTLRAAGPHIAHERGYALAIASLAAAVHPPLLGAYSASKAGVEALADSLRIELAPTGTRVGVAYFAELDADMVRQGFGTAAAKRIAEIRRPGRRALTRAPDLALATRRPSLARAGDRLALLTNSYAPPTGVRRRESIVGGGRTKGGDQMGKVKPLLVTLAATAAIAGGGAAIANAATSTSSTTGGSTTTSTAPATRTAPTAPGQGNHARPGNSGSGSHNCPNM
jgi:short chain dehydrogenase